MNRLTLVEYIEQLDKTIAKLEQQNEFEMCQQAKELKDAILTQNVEEFIRLCFDMDSLKEIGFIPNQAITLGELEKRIVSFYGYDSIFEYVFLPGVLCPYERYAQGIYDIFSKVDF